MLTRHPKLAALRGLLAEHAGRGGFHGLLFVRTRESAACLARLLAAAPDLRFLQVGRRVGGWVGGCSLRREGGGWKQAASAARLERRRLQSHPY